MKITKFYTLFLKISNTLYETVNYITFSVANMASMKRRDNFISL